MNNRAKGIRYELEMIKRLQSYYTNKLYSTRNMSRNLDNNKVDITNQDLDLNINFQLKTTSSTPNYLEILEDMPKDNKPNVIINRRTVRKNKNFLNIGDLVVMSLQDFELFLEKYNKQC